MRRRKNDESLCGLKKGRFIRKNVSAFSKMAPLRPDPACPVETIFVSLSFTIFYIHKTPYETKNN